MNFLALIKEPLPSFIFCLITDPLPIKVLFPICAPPFTMLPVEI